MKHLLLVTIASFALTGCLFKASKGKSKVKNPADANKALEGDDIALGQVGNKAKCSINGGGTVEIERKESGLLVTFLEENGTVKKIPVVGEVRAEGEPATEIDLVFDGLCETNYIDDAKTQIALTCTPKMIENLNIRTGGDNAANQAPIKKMSLNLSGDGKLAKNESRQETVGKFTIRTKYIADDETETDKDFVMGNDLRPNILQSCEAVAGAIAEEQEVAVN